jgi:hypothetical protein
MNPEDLADILGDEDEDEDEDAKWVTNHLLLSYNNYPDVSPMQTL